MQCLRNSCLPTDPAPVDQVRKGLSKSWMGTNPASHRLGQGGKQERGFVIRAGKGLLVHDLDLPWALSQGGDGWTMGGQDVLVSHRGQSTL